MKLVYEFEREHWRVWGKERENGAIILISKNKTLRIQN